jgi:hypothetical protein
MAPAPARDWSAFTPSRYQQDILTLVQTSPAHLVVEAVAGSGKSTTLEWLFAIAFQRQNAVFCAFNKSIATELERRLGRGRASTLNSLGHRTVSQAFGRLRLESAKYRRLASARWPYDRRSPEGRALSNVQRDSRFAMCKFAQELLGLLRGALEDPWDRGAILRLIDHHGVDTLAVGTRLEEVIAALPDLLNEGIMEARDGVIDFDDQIYLPHALNLPCFGYDVLCVDEAQDLNAAQHALTLRLAGPGGRIIAVGDPHQAIYGFRGAMADSIEQLSAALRQTDRGVRHAPLSVCYRCPTEVLALARELCPHIEEAPGADEGAVESRSPSEFLGSMAEGTGWLILCRTNAPLASAAFGLLKRRVPCRIMGRDIGEALVRLLGRAAPDVDDLDDALVLLRSYVGTETRRLNLAGRDKAAEALNDQYEAILALSEGLQTVAAFTAQVRDLFTNVDPSDDDIVFSSVHRAKGLEHDRVAILRPDLLPHPLATKMGEVEQEHNLEYVAITRAKQQLVMLPDPTYTRREHRREDPDLDADLAVLGLFDDPILAGLSPTAPDRAEGVTPVAQHEEANRLRAEREAAWERAKARQPPVYSNVLPRRPDAGSGEFDPPTIEDWREVQEEYRAAGLSAELVQPKGWQQWALMVGGRVQVSTTVDCYSDRARDKDVNAIDIVLVDGPGGSPQGGARKVLRTDAWQGRVCERINAMLQRAGLVHLGSDPTGEEEG